MPMEKKESPIACNIKALTAAQRARIVQLSSHLKTEVKEVRDLPSGFSYEFAPNDLTEIAEFVSLERLCCPFIDFEIQVECEGGPLSLRVTGRDGVKTFLKEELHYLLTK